MKKSVFIIIALLYFSSAHGMKRIGRLITITKAHHRSCLLPHQEFTQIKKIEEQAKPLFEEQKEASEQVKHLIGLKEKNTEQILAVSGRLHEKVQAVKPLQEELCNLTIFNRVFTQEGKVMYLSKTTDLSPEDILQLVAPKEIGDI